MSTGRASDSLDSIDQRVARLLANGQPDWAAIDFDLLCPRCDYNLRTLTRPRCPECGLEFEWASALARSLEQNELLFEHTWRRRPLRAWLRTLWVGLRPARFWRQVSIHDPVRVGPLVVLLIAASPISLIVLHSFAYLLSLGGGWLLRGVNALSGGHRADLDWAHRVVYQLDRLGTAPFSADARYGFLPAGALLAVGALLSLLLAMRQTLTRTRTRGVQVLRVMTYATGPMLSVAALFVVIVSCFLPLHLFLRTRIPLYAGAAFPQYPVQVSLGTGTVVVWRTDYQSLNSFHTIMIAAGWIGCGLLMTYYLAVPLRDYLRLPRPWLLAAGTAGVALLLSYTTLLLFGMIATGAWR